LELFKKLKTLNWEIYFKNLKFHRNIFSLKYIPITWESFKAPISWRLIPWEHSVKCSFIIHYMQMQCANANIYLCVCFVSIKRWECWWVMWGSFCDLIEMSASYSFLLPFVCYCRRQNIIYHVHNECQQKTIIMRHEWEWIHYYGKFLNFTFPTSSLINWVTLINLLNNEILLWALRAELEKVLYENNLN
jgi:hypothetical protein